MNLKVAKRLHDGLMAARNIEQFVSGRTFEDYNRMSTFDPPSSDSSKFCQRP